MIGDVIRIVLRFVFLVLLQVVVMNNINLASGLLVPFIYPLFILMLPLRTPGWLVLVLSLVLGLSIDSFDNTMGLHASACVAMGYFRGVILKMISPREGYDFTQKPTIQSMGTNWFMSYAVTLVLIHHVWIFNLENFQFDFFFRTQIRVLLSAAMTLGLVYLSQYMLYQVRERRR
ncbi:MAG: rod shape-determining protein MreD [Bacteroidota bacterium]